MSKIYISIKGGCIQEVISTNKSDKVEIWDWDNIEADCFDFKGNPEAFTDDFQDKAEKELNKLEKEYNKLSRKLHHLA